MITGNIKDCEKYYNVHPLFKEAFEGLKSFVEGTSTKYESDNLTFGIGCCTTSNFSPDGKAKVFEAHRKYLDIHFVAEGEECMGYANVNDLTPITDYVDDGDYQLLEGHINKIRLGKGDFCVVFPEDAHVPCMSFEDDKPVKRTVVKIRVAQ